MLALRLARPATRASRLFSTTPLRLAQTQEVLPPHDGVAFKAPPPVEDLKGKAVGQVDLPDMAAIEAVSEERAKIVRPPPSLRGSLAATRWGDDEVTATSWRAGGEQSS